MAQSQKCVYMYISDGSRIWCYGTTLASYCSSQKGGQHLLLKGGGHLPTATRNFNQASKFSTVVAQSGNKEMIRECVQNSKLLALLKVKIESSLKFEKQQLLISAKSFSWHHFRTLLLHSKITCFCLEVGVVITGLSLLDSSAGVSVLEVGITHYDQLTQCLLFLENMNKKRCTVHSPCQNISTICGTLYVHLPDSNFFARILCLVRHEIWPDKIKLGSDIVWCRLLQYLQTWVPDDM